MKRLIFLDGPEAFYEFAIGSGSLDIKLALFIVFILGMIIHGLDDTCTAPEEYSHDLKAGFLAVDAQNAQGVSAHLVVHALDEAVEEVVSLMQHDAFSIVFLVVHEIEGHGGVVPVLPEALQCLALVSGIHDQSLEVKEVEAIGNLRELILPRLLLGLYLFTPGLSGSLLLRRLFYSLGFLNSLLLLLFCLYLGESKLN